MLGWAHTLRDLDLECGCLLFRNKNRIQDSGHVECVTITAWLIFGMHETALRQVFLKADVKHSARSSAVCIM